MNLAKKSTSSFRIDFTFIFVNSHNTIPFFCSISTISLSSLAIPSFIYHRLLLFYDSLLLFFIFTYISLIFSSVFYNSYIRSRIVACNKNCCVERYLNSLLTSCFDSITSLKREFIYYSLFFITSSSSPIFLNNTVEVGFT